jgi:hypothetical protein
MNPYGVHIAALLIAAAALFSPWILGLYAVYIALCAFTDA